MILPYACDLTLTDHRGVPYRVPGWVTRDHGPDHDYRLLVVCEGYREFPSGIIYRLPADVPGQYCTWARLEDVQVREAEAA